MLKKRIKAVVQGVFCIAGISVFLSTVYAQAKPAGYVYRGIIISPSTVYVNLNPGEKYQGKIKLTHDFEDHKEFTFYPVTVNFKQLGESGNPSFYTVSGLPAAADSASWVSFKEKSYTLNYSENTDSNFEIKVPKDAEPGGRYLALVYSDKPALEENQQVTLGKEIAALVFLTVNGDINETGELVEFKTNKPWYEFTPVDFIIRYQNNGNVHTQIGGNIFIYKKDILNPVDTLQVNEEVYYALPNSIRQYDEQFNTGWITLEDGHLVFNKDRFPKVLFGKYQAELKLKHTVDNTRITTDGILSFWIIPWRLILVIIATIIVVFSLVVTLLVRRRQKKQAVPAVKPAKTD